MTSSFCNQHTYEAYHLYCLLLVPHTFLLVTLILVLHSFSTNKVRSLPNCLDFLLLQSFLLYKNWHWLYVLLITNFTLISVSWIIYQTETSCPVTVGRVFADLETTLLYSGHIYFCLGLNKQIYYLQRYLLPNLLC